MSDAARDDQSFVTGRLYADVIVPRHLSGPFTYAVPQHLFSTVRVGHRVEVPFGRALVQGAVTALTHRLPRGIDPSRLKEIRALVVDALSQKASESQFNLAKRVSDEYAAPLGQCLRLVLPPAIARSSVAGRLIATPAGLAALTANPNLSDDLRAIIKRLARKADGMKKATMLQGTGAVTQQQLASLVEKGWVAEIPQTARTVHKAGPMKEESDIAARSLPDVPREWEVRLIGALEKEKAEWLVLQAGLEPRIATLCRAIRHVVDRGRSVLVIVGEAGRASWMAGIISRHLDLAAVCFHSGLPEEEQANIWGQADRHPIVVGTRSAVFLPTENLGLIWVERDEDPALKEPKEPRYHARDVAWIRAQHQRCLLIVGSAHPSLETLTHAETGGLLLRREAPAVPSPAVEVVDLRLQDRRSLLSSLLREALTESIRQRAGALLFLNRKGFAGALICRDCGQVPRCRSCQVALTYYRQQDRLSCAYCGTSVQSPTACPSCAGPALQLVGEGTERVEDEVRQLWPHAAVVRADGDTMRTAAKAAAIWGRICRRDWDVLIGTQQVLRDYLVPPVNVVGVVQADAGLHLPDFRAAERTYHHLLDAAALVRSEGRVIIQTYLPDHHAIQSVIQGRDDMFRSEELSHRKALGYPPAVHLIVLHVSGADSRLVAKVSQEWVALLGRHSRPPESAVQGRSAQLVVLGPVPAPVPKLRGKTRLQILVKSEHREAGTQAVRATAAQLERTYSARVAKFDVDVDPVEMW